jgi:glycosyltransferase involved in cell wall biosynthesis
MATLSAFKLAFKPSDNTVGLVFKTMNSKPNAPGWQTFLRECQSDKRIQLITETLDRPVVLGLINACDAYVSLHRAEGFGRTLSEAMLLGKPVVATNYSGNIDFMHPKLNALVSYKLTPLSEQDYQWVDTNDQQVWADADISNAADCMSQIINEAKEQDYALQLKRFANKKFAPVELAEFFLDALSMHKEKEILV